MLKNKRKKSITLVIILSLLLVLSQTILFTWSPLRIGYNRFRFSNYDIYTKEDKLEKVFSTLDTIIVQNEKEHGLKYTKTPEIIICGVRDLMLNIPWTHYYSAPHGIWPHTVYLPKSAIDKYKNPVMAIKHELSHILLLQNFGESACATIWKKNEWLPEGFATYVTEGYPYYLSKQELLTCMNRNNIDYRIDSSHILSGNSIQNVNMSTRDMVNYYFTRYLIEKYGNNALRSLLYDAFKDPSNVIESFSEHFKVTYAKSLVEFYDYLLD